MSATTLTTLQAQDNDSTRFSLSTYGEVDGNFRGYTGNRFSTLLGPVTTSSSAITVPDVCLHLQYKPASRWTLDGEVAFVSGNGLELDQVSATYQFFPALSVMAGIFPLPIGHSNTDYGYVDYFMTGLPEGERELIPSPFTETGIALTGELPYGFNYHASVTTGLNGTTMSDQTWAAECRQGFLYDQLSLSSPAWTLRLGYSGTGILEGLQAGAGIYYCGNVARNMAAYNDYVKYQRSTLHFNNKYSNPILIWYADAEYQHRFFTVRASYLQGNLGHSGVLSAYLSDLATAGNTDVLITPNTAVARQTLNVMVEAGWNLKNTFFADTHFPLLFPYVHYEYYDSQYKGDTEVGTTMDPRGAVNLWNFGLTYHPIQGLAIKAGYTLRTPTQSYLRHMNDFTLGVAWDFTLLRL